MIPPFDIFHIADGGVLVRLESASSLDGAIARINIIGELNPCVVAGDGNRRST
jgi:hypothetical protein